MSIVEPRQPFPNPDFIAGTSHPDHVYPSDPRCCYQAYVDHTKAVGHTFGRIPDVILIETPEQLPPFLNILRYDLGNRTNVLACDIEGCNLPEKLREKANEANENLKNPYTLHWVPKNADHWLPLRWLTSKDIAGYEKNRARTIQIGTIEGVVGIIDLAAFTKVPPKELYAMLTDPNYVIVWWNQESDFNMWRAAYPDYPLNEENSFDAQLEVVGLPPKATPHGLCEIMERHYDVTFTGKTPRGMDLFRDLRDYEVPHDGRRIENFDQFIAYAAYDATLLDLMMSLAFLASNELVDRDDHDGVWDLFRQAFRKHPEIQGKVKIVQDPVGKTDQFQRVIIKETSRIYSLWYNSRRYREGRTVVYDVVGNRAIRLGAADIKDLFAVHCNDEAAQHNINAAWREIVEHNDIRHCPQAFADFANMQMRGAPYEVRLQRQEAKRLERVATKDRREAKGLTRNPKRYIKFGYASSPEDSVTEYPFDPVFLAERAKRTDQQECRKLTDIEYWNERREVLNTWTGADRALPHDVKFESFNIRKKKRKTKQQKKVEEERMKNLVHQVQENERKRLQAMDQLHDDAANFSPAQQDDISTYLGDRSPFDPFEMELPQAPPSTPLPKETSSLEPYSRVTDGEFTIVDQPLSVPSRRETTGGSANTSEELFQFPIPPPLSLCREQQEEEMFQPQSQQVEPLNRQLERIQIVNAIRHPMFRIMKPLWVDNAFQVSNLYSDEDVEVQDIFDPARVRVPTPLNLSPSPQSDIVAYAQPERPLILSSPYPHPATTAETQTSEECMTASGHSNQQHIPSPAEVQQSNNSQVINVDIPNEAHWDIAEEDPEENPPHIDNDTSRSSYNRILSAHQFTQRPIVGWNLRLHYYFFEFYDNQIAARIPAAIFPIIKRIVKNFVDRVQQVGRDVASEKQQLSIEQFLQLLSESEKDFRSEVNKISLEWTHEAYDDLIKDLARSIRQAIHQYVKVKRYVCRALPCLALIPFSRRRFFLGARINAKSAFITPQHREMFAIIVPRNSYWRTRDMLEEAYAERNNLELENKHVACELLQRIEQLENVIRIHTVELLSDCKPIWENIERADQQHGLKLMLY